MQVYCGNNQNHSKIVNGTHRFGTNYECLRKGIGTGRHMAYDPEFNNQYNPLDDRKFYCGNNQNLPNGYFGVGSPSKCLQIGIGLGKVQRALLGQPSFFRRFRIEIILILLYIVINTLLIRFLPNYDKVKIVLICSLVFLIIWIIIKKYFNS